MSLYNNILNIFLAVSVLLLSSCSKQEHPATGAAEEAMVTICPILQDHNSTRAIGDATGIDQLTVSVYEILEGQTIYRFTHTENNWNRNSLSISLLKGRNYKLLFWAENSNNTAYSFNPDNGSISVDYSNYTQGGFSSMEQLDAFYAAAEIQNVKTDNIDIDLTRPLAQLNFADKTQPPVPGTHKTEVTYTGIPTGFNLLTESIESYSSEPVTFTFDDYTSEELDIESTPYYYVATNYIFAPTSISVSVELKTADGSATINSFEFTGNGAIPLEKNMKTNIIGSFQEDK